MDELHESGFSNSVPGLSVDRRIVVRRFSGDQQEHAYPVEQLDVPRWHHLIPLCASWAYPRRHPRDMVGEHDLPSFGSSFDRCPLCGVLTRGTSFVIVVRGKVDA